MTTRNIKYFEFSSRIGWPGLGESRTQFVPPSFFLTNHAFLLPLIFGTAEAESYFIGIYGLKLKRLYVNLSASVSSSDCTENVR